MTNKSRITAILLKLSLILILPGCSGWESKSQDQEVALNTLQSRVITAQGEAPISPGAELLARKQALQSALQNIAMQAGAGLTQATLIGSTKVVDEWRDDNIYRVQVLATLGAGDNAESCHSPFRKNIVATGFPIVTPGQISANESQDLYSGIPREITNLLLESGEFNSFNETHAVLYPQPDIAPQMSKTSGYYDSLIVQMARQYNAQFVLSGVIRDLEVESTQYTRGSGALAGIKSMMRDLIARRGVGLDVYVHDGLTGALVFQHRYSDSVVGDVWIPSGYTVGSERFRATPTGQKITEMLLQAARDVRHLLSCYPLTTQIIRIDGANVFLAAGAQAKLRPGDSLVVYAKNHLSDIKLEQEIGVIKIIQVQSDFSVGRMEVLSDIRQIRPGDLARSW